MNQSDLPLSSYNYYPRTMISLCVISYEDMSSISGLVHNLGLEVVWGPAELISSLGVSYSLMYIARNTTTGEYMVVIRGTNPTSLTSWLDEDFDIKNKQAFNQLAPHAPADAMVSQGTFNGTKDLIGLTDPISGQTAADYLAGVQPKNLYVTGHSLGGTLTPPMFAYLNDVLYGGGYVTNMACWSFAGLTSGDDNFASYFNGLFNPDFPWRIHNTLDIAPFLFYSESDIENIYSSNGLSWGFPEDDIIKKLFEDAKGNNYTQPVGDQPLTGTFNTHFWEDHMWALQASYQHHATTYQPMVDAEYPFEALIDPISEPEFIEAPPASEE